MLHILRSHPDVCSPRGETNQVFYGKPDEPFLTRLSKILRYVPIMLLALVGVWRTRRLDWPYRLCWLPAVYFTLLHVVFVASMRYRDPAMLVMIVLAAGFSPVTNFLCDSTDGLNGRDRDWRSGAGLLSGTSHFEVE